MYIESIKNETIKTNLGNYDIVELKVRGKNLFWNNFFQIFKIYLT